MRSKSVRGCGDNISHDLVASWRRVVRSATGDVEIKLGERNAEGWGSHRHRRRNVGPRLFHSQGGGCSRRQSHHRRSWRGPRGGDCALDQSARRRRSYRSRRFRIDRSGARRRRADRSPVLTPVHGIAESIKNLKVEEAVRSARIKIVAFAEIVGKALPRLKPTSSIVLFGGAAKARPYPGSTMVTIVNGGMIGMARTLAVELSPIRVNGISPGLVEDCRGGRSASRRARVPPSKRCGRGRRPAGCRRPKTSSTASFFSWTIARRTASISSSTAACCWFEDGDAGELEFGPARAQDEARPSPACLGF